MSQIQIIHAGLTDVGLVRKANEDHLGFENGPYGPLFVVCDGMGGHAGGAAASELAVKCIGEFIAAYTDDNVPVAIHNAIIFANEQILQTAAQNPDLAGMGTTATVLLVRTDGIYFGHIGDSRIYLLSDGKLHRLTKDHSFVQTLVDSGAITDAEAESHPRKNEIMRALGVTAAAQPAVISSPVQPKPGDIFMLCTDGLCGLVTDAEMERLLNSQAKQLDAACQTLINAAKTAGGHDNITVQLVGVTASPYTVSRFDDLSPKKAPDLSVTDVMPAPAPAVTPAAGTPPPVVQQRQQQSTALPKLASKQPIIIAVLAIVLTALGITYFSGIWPFNPGTATVQDSTGNTPKKPITNTTNTTPNQPAPSELLPGDNIDDDDSTLIHTVTQGESLAKVINDRKNADNLIYKRYDFSKTLAPNDTEINTNDLKGFSEIKWQLLPGAPQSGLDIKTTPPPAVVAPVTRPTVNTGKTGGTDLKPDTRAPATKAELEAKLRAAATAVESAENALTKAKQTEAAAKQAAEDAKDDKAKKKIADQALKNAEAAVKTAEKNKAAAERKHNELSERLKKIEGSTGGTAPPA